ncbi:MAG: hypothetical protein ACOYKE_05190 [Ferruginibacter sp.]
MLISNEVQIEVDNKAIELKYFITLGTLFHHWNDIVQLIDASQLSSTLTEAWTVFQQSNTSECYFTLNGEKVQLSILFEQEEKHFFCSCIIHQVQDYAVFKKYFDQLFNSL